MSDARRRAEEALATVALRYPNGWGAYDTLSVCTDALRAFLAEPAPACGSVSTVRSDDPFAAPLPTCAACGSNFIEPAPAADYDGVELACFCGYRGPAVGHPATPHFTPPVPAPDAVAEAANEVAPQLEGFCVQAETDARPPGGQQAGLDKSWASRVPPSVLTELRWYAREFRRLLAALDARRRG